MHWVHVSKLPVQTKGSLRARGTLTARVFLLAAGSRCPVHFDLLQTPVGHRLDQAQLSTDTTSTSF